MVDKRPLTDLCAPLGIRFRIANAVRDVAATLKGSHSMRDGRIFLKDFLTSLFNDDLSNKPNFGRIHLAG